jgi:kynureninase
MAAIKASLDLFEKVGMDALREKSKKLTGYFEFLIDEIGSDDKGSSRSSCCAKLSVF